MTDPKPQLSTEGILANIDYCANRVCSLQEELHKARQQLLYWHLELERTSSGALIADKG